MKKEIEATSEGSQGAWGNFRGTLFTTPVKITSQGPSGNYFSRNVLYMRIMPRFEGNKSKSFVVVAALTSGRVVEYPLEKYSDFVFDRRAGIASFKSRGQEFSITVIEESPAVSEDPQVKTGDATNG